MMEVSRYEDCIHSNPRMPWRICHNRVEKYVMTRQNRRRYNMCQDGDGLEAQNR